MNWAGFYLLERRYAGVGAVSRGRIACVRIPVGRGIVRRSGSTQNKVQRIDDVHAFDGHIACDAASNASNAACLRLANGLSACWI